MLLTKFTYKRSTFLISSYRSYRDTSSRLKVWHLKNQHKSGQKHSFSTFSIIPTYTILPPTFSSTTKLCSNKSPLFFSCGMKSVGHASKVLDAVRRNESQSKSVTTNSNNANSIDKSFRELEISSKLPTNFTGQDTSTGSSTAFSSKIFNALIPSVTSSTTNANKLRGVITQESDHVILHKYSIHEFLSYFSSLDSSNINDISQMIHYFRILLETQPHLHNRATQLAFESISKKVFFPESLFQEIFADISFIDLVGRNNGLHDQSSLYSLLQTDLLLAQPGFKNNTTVVVATCSRSHDLSNVNEETRKTMALMKQATGNSVSDLILDGHPHDFKITTDISLTKNWIIYLDFSCFDSAAKSRIHLFNLVVQLKKDYDKNNNLSEDQRQFLKTAFVELQTIFENKLLNPVEKSLAWNSFIFGTLHTRPRGVMLPILVPTSQVPFQKMELPDSYNKIAFPTSKSLNSESVRQYVNEMTQSWTGERKCIAYQGTKGALGFPTKNNDDTNTTEDK